MRLEDALTIGDLRTLARRRLPRVVFDWLDGGAGDEHGLARNVEHYRSYGLLPRYLVDVAERSLGKTLFGKFYRAPFGIAPTGFAGLFRPNADLMLARAARDSNLPFILSGASCASIEAVAKVGSPNAWYQLYAARDYQITYDLVRRVQDAGIETLVITVDLPVEAKRLRDLRNRFDLPLRLTPSLVLDLIRHPAWVLSYLKTGGTPYLENYVPYTKPGATAAEVALFVGDHSYSTMTWADLESIRRLWKGKLVIKGIMHPADATAAVQCGADGIIVSNHGGRQFDRAPTSLEVLKGVVEVVGRRATIMLDGGIRNGSDIAVALALGADFCFVGRATLFGAAAAGYDGAVKAIEILNDELDRTLGQIGCKSVYALGPEFLLGAR